jgi:hypothetical protein
LRSATSFASSTSRFQLDFVGGLVNGRIKNRDNAVFGLDRIRHIDIAAIAIKKIAQPSGDPCLTISWWSMQEDCLTAADSGTKFLQE